MVTVPQIISIFYFILLAEANLWLIYVTGVPDFPLSQAIENEGAAVQALRARRQVILDNIRDNDEAGVNYQKVVCPSSFSSHRTL